MNNEWEEWVKSRKAFLGQHHPLCNFFLDDPADTCTMCKDLHKEFRKEKGPIEEQIKAHFPDVKRIDNET